MPREPNSDGMVTRKQACAILECSYDTVRRLEITGKISRGSRNGVAVYPQRQLTELAARRSLPQLVSPDCVLLLGPIVAELGSMGFCDEHGTVSPASIIAAAKKLRERVREARLAEQAPEKTPPTLPAPELLNGKAKRGRPTSAG